MTAFVTEAILAEATTYVVTRFAAGSWANGIYTPGATSSVNVAMTVQPLRPKEIELLPEGIRNRELVKCHATSELRAADQTSGAAGDRFTWNAEVFEVIQVADWSKFGGYWRAVAARVQG